MTTVFSHIIAGDFPGRFAYADDQCVVFSTIEPIKPGHMLVVPRLEVDRFAEAPDDLAGHLMTVARRVAAAQEVAYPGTRAVLMIAGFDVPHLHLHVVPAANQADLSFAHAHADSDEALDEACMAVREALRGIGFGAFVPADMTAL